MKTQLVLFVSILSVLYSCDYKPNKANKIVKREVINNVDSIYLKSSLDGLNIFQNLIILDDIRLEKSFPNYSSNNVSPMDFIRWNKHYEDEFEETIVLIFLKMFHKDISPEANDITYQAESKPLLYFMIYKFYEMSGEAPSGMILLSNICEWIIYNYETENKNILAQKERLINEFNLAT